MAFAMVCVSGGGQTAGSAVQGHAYAIFSPAVIALMPQQAKTPVGQKVIHMADEALSATPDPMAHIHTTHTLPGQSIRDQSVAAEHDWDRMLMLGLAYRLTGDTKYLQAETRFLSAWTAVYTPDLLPIDETNMDKILIAFDLTRADLPAAVQQKTLQLFAAMAAGYLKDIAKNSCGKDIANWQSHRIKLATLSAYSIGDAALIASAKKFYEAQVGCNIRPDGSVEDFYKRDALHYVVYDLEPLETAALAGQAHGQDWFHYTAADGRSVPHAVEWVIPYTTGAKTHEEFVHSTVPFDAERDKAGEKGYSGPWEPKNGTAMLALATMLDPKYKASLDALTKSAHSTPTAWMLLWMQARMGAGTP